MLPIGDLFFGGSPESSQLALPALSTREKWELHFFLMSNPDNPRAQSFSLSYKEDCDASNKEVIGSKEVVRSEVQQRSEQDRRERDAAKEARDIALRAWW